MPQKLSEPVEDQIRKYLVGALRPAEIEGYDPSQTDTTAGDYILITSDNDNYGDYYPLIFVSNNQGATVPGGGETNITGIQGSGSGTNQDSIFSVSIQCQAVENGPYLNSTAYDELAFTLYQECKYQLKQADTSDFPDAQFVGELTPSPIERTSDEQDSSTETWAQYSGTIPIGIMFTP